MRRLHRSRGLSLVEALVALAVMAFGMLAIVGIQSTMRLNSDVAKQRSEATRIAQEAIERWRGYSVLDTVAGRVAYADIASSEADEVVAGYTTNTTYRLSRSVTDLPVRNQKVLQVVVRWADRTAPDGETNQVVVFNTVIGNADPALTGALVTPAAGNPARRPRDRHSAIPWNAKDLGNGRSAFKPPVAGGGTTAWVFNNVTGFITGVCEVPASLHTQDLTTVDVASCSDNTTAQLLSGFVRFHSADAQPTAADAEQPLGLARRLDVTLLLTSSGHPQDPDCYDDAPESTSEAAGSTFVSYYCAVYSNPTRTWAGYSTIVALPFVDEPTSVWSIPTPQFPAGSTHQLCRYTPAASDTQVVPNWQHPKLYRVEYLDPATQQLPIQMPPLPNQNFLVVDAAFTCPTDVPADPAAGDYVNSNTLPHLPWPPMSP
jgi:Tfp pilus assembly protein PilV